MFITNLVFACGCELREECCASFLRIVRISLKCLAEFCFNVFLKNCSCDFNVAFILLHNEAVCERLVHPLKSHILSLK